MITKNMDCYVLIKMMNITFRNVKGEILELICSNVNLELYLSKALN